ncbi:14079_t:CDS:2 [Acaulospora morrowiae]|uniref:14079_t:CDS:1 n=1 Tax=Acaulospora morrowiae TaxID=94023 RepID=A0A9N9ARR1_9GLOM|nr:14079_t:CDS:2 [Acaulospora morrowiae]
MNSSAIHNKWVEDAIRSRYVTEFDHYSFREIEIILTTPLTDIKKAYQIGFDRNVVLKYLREEQYKVEDVYHKNFLREVRNLARLNEFNNENIVKFLGISKGIKYFINRDLITRGLIFEKASLFKLFTYCY